MSSKWNLFGLTWLYPRSFVDRDYNESKVYIRWGYLLTFFPLLGLMPFAFLVLDGDIAKPYVLVHAFLAVIIAFLIYMTYCSSSGVIVSYLTFATFAAGGTSLNVAAILNSSPPIIYTMAGHFECMLLLFVAVRVPWVSTIFYGIFVIAVYVYIVTDVWTIQSLDAIIISVALVFVLFLVSVGCYARDKQTFELYLTQDSIKEMENERVRWSKMLTQFLSHEISNHIAGIAISFQMLSKEEPDRENVFVSRGMHSVDALKKLVGRAAEAVNIEDLVERIDVQIFDIMDLLEDVAADFYQRLPEGRSMQVENFYQNGAYTIRGDYLLLKQMIRNIIDNAIRHSAPGTAIEIILTKEGRIEVVNEGDALPDNIETMFGLGSNQDSEKQGLYGLGLYLARKIAIAHQGSLSASSPEGYSGAVFSILLPKSPYQ